MKNRSFDAEDYASVSDYLDDANAISFAHDDVYDDDEEWYKLNGPIRTYKLRGGRNAET